jgi:hypothetical protein
MTSLFTSAVKNGVEARFFGLARDALDFAGAPANTGEDRESESIGDESLLSSGVLPKEETETVTGFEGTTLTARGPTPAAM